MAVELRGLSTGLRASNDDGAKKIAGYAAIFGSETQIAGPFSAGGGFIEKIDPRAFSRRLSEGADIRALNHNPDHVLGRSKSGTLKVSTDNVGCATK
jgi:phage head maturation protease